MTGVAPLSAFGVEHPGIISKAAGPAYPNEPRKPPYGRAVFNATGIGASAGGAFHALRTAQGATRTGKSFARAATKGGLVGGGAATALVGADLALRRRERNKQFAKADKRSRDRAEHYGRMAGTTGAMGAGLGAVGGGAGIVGHLESKGKDPMGFVHAEHGARKVGTAARMKILKPNAVGHRWQARTLGGAGAASLGIAGAYKVKQRHELKKDLSPRSRTRLRQAGDVGLGAGTAGVAGIALKEGGKHAHILNQAANSWGREARGAHHVIAGHQQGAIEATKPELKAARANRKVGARVFAVKKPAAALTIGATAAGGASLYELGRHATRRRKEK